MHPVILRVVLAALVLATTEASGAEGKAAVEAFDYQRALALSQGAIGNQVGGYAALDSSGRSRSLLELRGKPLVMSLVYTSCHQICPMTTRYLAEVVGKAREALGPDSFNAAIVGFDASADTPESMRYYARKQGLEEYGGWEVLSMNPEELDGLMRDVGFVSFPAPHGFDHLIQVTVIDAQGRVHGQIYGQVFDTPLLVEPLKQLVLGRSEGGTMLSQLVDKVRLFCTVYDPARDGYVFDYSLFIGIAIGGLIILLICVFLARELVGRRRTPCG